MNINTPDTLIVPVLVDYRFDLFLAIDYSFTYEREIFETTLDEAMFRERGRKAKHEEQDRE